MSLVLNDTDIRSLLVDGAACVDAINSVERAIAEYRVRVLGARRRPRRPHVAGADALPKGPRFGAVLCPAVDDLASLAEFEALLTSVLAAVGIRHLLPSRAETTMAALGSGVRAQSCIYMIAAAIPSLTCLRLWAPGPPQTDAAMEMERTLRSDVRMCAAASDAVSGADVVVIVPDGTQPPPVHRMDIPQGSLVFSISGAGLHLLDSSARLVVPVSPIARSLADGGRVKSHSELIDLADITLGRESREPGGNVVVYDVAGPLIWDTIVVQWVNDWIDRRTVAMCPEL